MAVGRIIILLLLHLTIRLVLSCVGDVFVLVFMAIGLRVLILNGCTCLSGRLGMVVRVLSLDGRGRILIILLFWLLIVILLMWHRLRLTLGSGRRWITGLR